jgi:mannose-6-phosphate isomerase-like protein (cupin superfamily)
MSEAVSIHAPTFFDLKTPFLDQGRSRKNAAASEVMTIVGMVYAEGGENAMHSHINEDHVFLILQGQATFHIETDDNVRVVNKYDGVLIPEGCNYWFTSTGDENLVVARVGARHHDGKIRRAFPDGTDFDGSSEANKQVPMIVRPGHGFGDS